MNKKIRCYFTDFWDEFDYKFHLGFLLSEYEIVLDKVNPDYLFYSCFGMDHLNYDNSIKIFWSGENVVPDLNLCDYAMSLSDIQCGDRTCHQYLTLIWKDKKMYDPNLTASQLLNRKFCNFVYSNNCMADPIREKFFKALSKYKRVDAGGSFLNNIGGRVVDKHSFLKEYKFTIAIENSSLPGYSTEKILDPFLARSLPLYWGDPNISSDYHPNSFVNLMDYSSVEEAVEEIIRLDNDDDAYLQKVTTPFWSYGDSFEEFCDAEKERLLAFYRHIFDQPLEKAGRRTKYGCAMSYSRQMRMYYFFPERIVMGRIKRLIKKINIKQM